MYLMINAPKDSTITSYFDEKKTTLFLGFNAVHESSSLTLCCDETTIKALEECLMHREKFSQEHEYEECDSGEYDVSFTFLGVCLKVQCVISHKVLFNWKCFNENDTDITDVFLALNPRVHEEFLRKLHAELQVQITHEHEKLIQEDQ